MTALRYLIVDDSPTVRLTIRQALGQEKVPADRIAEAGSAHEAMAAFDRAPADVVFLDVSLQEGTKTVPAAGQILDILHPPPTTQGGNDVARYMLAKNPKLTIVVCTGNPPDDPRVRELIQGGAFQLLQKPVRLAQIREVLRQVRDERAAADSDA
jgi:DNA-binding NarL/FixJ family response regulator